MKGKKGTVKMRKIRLTRFLFAFARRWGRACWTGVGAGSSTNG